MIPSRSYIIILLHLLDVIDVVGGVLAAQALVLLVAPGVEEVAEDGGRRRVGKVVGKVASKAAPGALEKVRKDLLLEGRHSHVDDVAHEGEVAELQVAHGWRLGV